MLVDKGALKASVWTDDETKLFAEPGEVEIKQGAGGADK